ncbi:MAG: hypothetical protein JW882_09955 [Deltaproteobacteria bacterium]|nr:hypothetical protein [Deltaproteobacteria bacterium]
MKISIHNTLILILAIITAMLIFIAYDYVSSNFREYERRIAALEAEARPLFVVDKYSTVFLNGEELSLTEGTEKINE